MIFFRAFQNEDTEKLRLAACLNCVLQNIPPPCINEPCDPVFEDKNQEES